MNSNSDLLKFVTISTIIHLVVIVIFNGVSNGLNDEFVNELKKKKSEPSLVITFMKESDPNQEMLDFIAEHNFDDLVEESGEVCPLPPFGEYKK